MAHSVPYVMSSNLLYVICNSCPIDSQLILRFLKFMDGENDWHDYIIGNLVRETIHMRDYETTELSRDQMDCILQYITINY